MKTTIYPQWIGWVGLFNIIIFAQITIIPNISAGTLSLIWSFGIFDITLTLNTKLHEKDFFFCNIGIIKNINIINHTPI